MRKGFLRDAARNHPLIKSLFSLEGNPKISVFTEPLWGIPYQLYMPFAAVYMSALGVSDDGVGNIASISLLFRALAALFSGVVTDKLGRRRATVIFDILSWSVPCLIWTLSQNFWWFAVAAALNGLWQVTENSWTCLLVEDARKDQMVNIYNWIHVSGQLAIFFAPLSGLLVETLTVVPALRILYLFSFFSMTAKFLILYRYCDETRIGKIRMEECRGQSILQLLAGYKNLLPKIFRSKMMVLALTITVLFNITTTVIQSFFGLYATQNLALPQRYLAFFPIVRSVIILLFLFWGQPILNRMGLKKPMVLGILVYIASHVLLLNASLATLPLVLGYVVLEACAHAMVMPRKDSIMALYVDPDERARIVSIMTVIWLGVTMPFGYIAGQLASWDRRLPFLLDIAVYLIALAVVAGSRALSQQTMPQE